MKIKVNQQYPDHRTLMKMIAMECPELEVRVKERKWGPTKPSFKYKKRLYEFNQIHDLIEEIRKLKRKKELKAIKKRRNLGKDNDPLEEAIVEERFPMNEE